MPHSLIGPGDLRQVGTRPPRPACRACGRYGYALSAAAVWPAHRPTAALRSSCEFRPACRFSSATSARSVLDELGLGRHQRDQLLARELFQPGHAKIIPEKRSNPGQHKQSDLNSHLWPPHAQPHQLWYFHRTEQRHEVQIVSVANGLALDAKIGRETPRQAVMWSRHGQSHQRWRLHPTGDGAACIIESVRTGHALDVPWEAGPETHTPPVLYERHGGENQQFVIATPSRVPS